MTKPELVKAVATEAEMTNKDAEKAVNAMLEVITDALDSGERYS